MRESCIFCHSPLDGSDEHIIPESVNGRLHSKQLICHHCNSKKFGRHLDPVLAETFKTVGHLLGLKKARPLQVQDPSGRKYLMEKSGKVSVVAPEYQVQRKDGFTYINVTGDPKNTLRKFAKLAAPYWNPDHKSENLKVSTSEGDNPPLSAELKIEVTGALVLLINKIILEFYAHCGLDLRLVTGLTERVNALDFTVDNVFFTNFRQEVREFGNEEISHLITIRSQGNYLYGYLEIFNVLCGVIILTEDFGGEDLEATYHQDALAGERLQGPVTVTLPLEILAAPAAAPSPDEFSLLLGALLERNRSRQFQDIFDKTIRQIEEEVQQEVNEGKIPLASHEEEYVKRSCEAIAYLTVYEFPYILEDALDEQNDLYNHLHSNLREEQFDPFFEMNRHAIGMRLDFGEGDIYRLDTFIKTPVFKRGEVNIVKIHCLLIQEETGFKRYLPFREFYEGVGQPNEKGPPQ
ncbi:HNH endonuclease [Rufibacter latericius]|uniref:HNH endonuclease 5 domain-containing protein n=1 Tax=Rufibacter latericius TaxID=2487040 RepID=A0A3M9MGR3_9BACT|nr:HNH endonuclease [Rufibacter latericius]RNI24063.1 hypothetical protein EFB08_16945 [Rufibacter latericius]